MKSLKLGSPVVIVIWHVNSQLCAMCKIWILVRASTDSCMFTTTPPPPIYVDLQNSPEEWCPSPQHITQFEGSTVIRKSLLHRHSYGEEICLGEKSTVCHILSEQRLQNALESLYAARSFSYSELITFHTSCNPPSIRLRSLGMVLSLQGNVGPIQSFFSSFLYCSDTGETPQTY
jgi:hypothetical protein